jgi:hypothetical protein
MNLDMSAWRNLVAILAVLLAGCAQFPSLRQATLASFEPTNVYREHDSLPMRIKRVAVLPLTVLTEDSASQFGRETLGPLLIQELTRSRQFELVAVTPEELRVITGRSLWTAEERMPADFFAKLKEQLGVDAVLFARLTQYRPYEPLSMGWRLKLLEVDEPRVLWAVDEVFDARVPQVAAGARRFAQQNPETPGLASDSEGVLTSPRRFAQYTVNSVVATLPGRAH